MIRSSKLLVITILIGVAGPALAQDVPTAVQEALQVKAEGRVFAVATRYAKTIGIDADYVGYCSAKMELSHGRPRDGSIPWGVDYNHINQATLDETLLVRERYERDFLILCLADAKNSLTHAAAK